MITCHQGQRAPTVVVTSLASPTNRGLSRPTSKWETFPTVPTQTDDTDTDTDRGIFNTTAALGLGDPLQLVATCVGGGGADEVHRDRETLVASGIDDASTKPSSPSGVFFFCHALSFSFVLPGWQTRAVHVVARRRLPLDFTASEMQFFIASYSACTTRHVGSEVSNTHWRCETLRRSNLTTGAA